MIQQMFARCKHAMQWVRMSFLAWWYKKVNKTSVPPPEVRRHLMKRGLEQLQGQNLPPAMQKEVAVNLLTASMDADVFGDMADDLMEDAFRRFATIPTEHCARCKAPVATQEATRIEGSCYCETCAKTRK